MWSVTKVLSAQTTLLDKSIIVYVSAVLSVKESVGTIR